VPLDPPALDPLDDYLAHRSGLAPTAPLLASHGHRSEGGRLNTRSVRGRINEYLRAARLKRRGISPHSLTHTAALIWLNDGMPVEEVRRRMRHGTLETTMISFKRQGLLTRPLDDPA
jgi:integrase/recombinase XerC/integrase/recombinase XerD